MRQEIACAERELDPYARSRHIALAKNYMRLAEMEPLAVMRRLSGRCLGQHQDGRRRLARHSGSETCPALQYWERHYGLPCDLRRFSRGALGRCNHPVVLGLASALCQGEA